MKIGIAGAGLLGRLLALQLLQESHEVHVFDPASGPHERGAAGWTAAGMLSPTAELESADENVFNLGLRSIDQWSNGALELFCSERWLYIQRRHPLHLCQRITKVGKRTFVHIIELQCFGIEDVDLIEALFQNA